MESIKLFKISEIAELLRNNVLTIPPVQRGKVWNAVRVEILWDSLLRGIPIGYLTVRTNSENKYDLFDGQQRCNAISMGYSNFNIESNSILWFDLGMSSAETEQEDEKIKHSNRRFFFRVTSQAHPWGYKLSDNETKNKTLKAWEQRDAVEKIQGKWDNQTKQRPSPYELWPVEAKFPVPFTLLRQFCEQTLNKTFDEFWLFCKQKGQGNNWNWLEHFENIFAKNDEECQKIYKQAKSIFGELNKKQRIHKLDETIIVAQNAAGILDEDVGLYFKRMNKAGVEPSDAEIRYSLLKSRIPVLKQLDGLASDRMQPARLADIAMKTYFIIEQKKWKNNITNSDLDFLTSAANKENWVKYVTSDFKNYIETVERWLVYDAKKNKIGLPRFVYSSIARSNTQDIYSLLIFLAASGYKFDDEISRKNLIALVTLICWFGTEKNRSSIASKGYNIYLQYAQDAWLTATRQWLFDSVKENLLLLPPPPSIYKDIQIATKNKQWNDLQQAWNPLWYRNALDKIWYWNKKESRELLLYACREYLEKEFPKYDSADAVWCEENCPWDYDHIFPQSWLIYGKGNKQGDFHELVDTFLNSIGNIAPLAFSKNRGKNDAPPQNYQGGDDNILLFVNTENNEDFFWKKNKAAEALELNEEKAFTFATITAERLCKLYSNWYDDLEIGSLMDFFGIEDKRNALYCAIRKQYPDAKLYYVAEDGRQNEFANNSDWARQWLAVGIEAYYENNKSLLCIASNGNTWEVGYRRHPDAAEINGDSNNWWFKCDVFDAPDNAKEKFLSLTEQKNG